MRNMFFLSKDTSTNEWKSVRHKRRHVLPTVDGTRCGNRNELRHVLLADCMHALRVTGTRYEKKREKKTESIEYGVPW